MLSTYIMSPNVKFHKMY